jgi:hypothetical protein
MDGSFLLLFAKIFGKVEDFFFNRSLATPGAEGQEAAAT